MEQVNNRGWVHDEMVALGAVIIAWHCGERPEPLISRLEACRVRWKPEITGTSRDELKRGLAFTPRFLVDWNEPSVLGREPITGAKFDALWEFLA